MCVCVKRNNLLEYLKAECGNKGADFAFSLDKNVVESMPSDSKIKDQLFVKTSLSRSSQAVSVSASVVFPAPNAKENDTTRISPFGSSKVLTCTNSVIVPWLDISAQEKLHCDGLCLLLLCVDTPFLKYFVFLDQSISRLI